MQKKVLGREVAEKEFDEIAEYWDWIGDTPESDLVRERLVRVLMAGSLVFNKDEETFTYTFRKPIMCENDKTISEITLRELTAGDTRFDASKMTDTDATIRMISASSGLPVGVVDRLGIRDIGIIGALIGFFS